MEIKTIPKNIENNSQSFFDDIGISPFKPLNLMQGAFVQTFLPALIPQIDLRKTRIAELHLSEENKINIAINKPRTWEEKDRIVMMVHGLTGTYQSNYMIRMARKLFSAGYLVIRVNMRSCEKGFVKSRGTNHSGRSEDTRAAVAWIHRQWPKAPITLIGFSLGGNISLKMAGEDGHESVVENMISVSAPIDLSASADKLSLPKNRFFDQYFVKRLTQEAVNRRRCFPEMTIPELPKGLNLISFDHLYTAPHGGFSSGSEYYESCSSKHFISKITIPTILICANDDPIIDQRAYFELISQKNIDVVFTQKGGHLGFIDQACTSWMDHFLLASIRKMAKQTDKI